MKKRRLLALGLAAVAAVGCTTVVSCGGSKSTTSKTDKDDEKTAYSVQFVVNGGSDVAKQTVEAGNTISTVTTTREGYTFAGWYTDAELTAAFDVATPINASTILYAKWTETITPPPTVTTYTVTFNTNGGSAVASQTVNSGSAITAVSTTRDGYTFAGWYIDSACTTEFKTTTPITTNTTLYAKWTEKIVPYNVLSKAADNIYSNDFETAGSVDLASISIDDTKAAGSKNSINWGANQGLYKFISKDGTPGSANDVTISNGKLNLVNTSSTIGTQVIYDLGNPATTGVVQICVDLTLPSSAIAGITPIQIYGKDTAKTTTAELFGIRTVEATVDGTKSTFFQYRKDGVGKTQGTDGKDNSWYEGLVDGKNVNGATYTFLFKIDLSTGKISVELNGDAYVTDLDLGITEVQGIRFASGDGNTKTFTLDNLAVNGVVADVPLSEVQAKAKTNLDTYVTNMNVATNYTTNASKVEEIVTLQKAAIDAATTKELVNAAYDAAIAELKTVKSDLAIAKEAKIADLDSVYNGAKASYTDAYNGAAYTAAYNALKTAINGAATKAALEAITYETMTSIKTDAEQEALNSLPTYSVTGVVEDVKKETFTSQTKNDKLGDGFVGTTNTFKVAKGTASKMKMNAAYLNLFSGNTITFTAANDGATFAIGYNGMTDVRIVKLTSADYTVQKAHADKTKDSANAVVKTYNGLTVTNGWLIFDNLKAGTYTVTFDETGTNAGVVDKSEQKIEHLVLIDHKNGSEDKTVTAINATQTLSGFDVTLTLDGVDTPVTLASTEYAVKYLNDANEEVSFTTATKAEITYTNAGKSVKTTVTLAA